MIIIFYVSKKYTADLLWKKKTWIPVIITYSINRIGTSPLTDCVVYIYYAPSPSPGMNINIDDVVCRNYVCFIYLLFCANILCVHKT